MLTFNLAALAAIYAPLISAQSAPLPGTTLTSLSISFPPLPTSNSPPATGSAAPSVAPAASRQPPSNGRTVPQYVGTYNFDCNGSPEACNNACFYHYCVATVPGAPAPQYFDDGGGTRLTSGNSINSGVDTIGEKSWQTSSTCLKLPISQRMFDPRIPSNPNIDLETDEFPMAAMMQGPFVAGTIHNTLRCIQASDNRSGGAKYGLFSSGQGPWGVGGALSQYRFDPGHGLLQGDWFDLAFLNVDVQQSPYCALPAPPNKCDNDGFQFHLTQLRQSTNARPLGLLGAFPYDATSQNTYKITYDPSNNNLDEYSVTVIRSGINGENVDIGVYDQAGINLADSTTQQNIGNNQVIQLTGLPRTLSVTIPSGLGTRLQFQYDDPVARPINALSFTSDSEGASDQFPWSTQSNPSGKYCQRSCEPSGPPAPPGQITETTECWFSGY